MIRLRTGQSLLEGVIAIGVILVSVIAATTLIVNTTRVGRLSQDRVEAANLAREGIEVVRLIRDTNWLERDHNLPDGSATVTSWDDSGSNADGYIPLDNRSDSNPTRYVAEFTSGQQWQLVSFSGTPTVQDTVNRIAERNQTLTQNCTVACNLTKFWRVISILGDTETVSAIPAERMQITSTVYWNDRGVIRSLVAEQHLYDWR